MRDLILEICEVKIECGIQPFSKARAVEKDTTKFLLRCISYLEEIGGNILGSKVKMSAW